MSGRSYRGDLALALGQLLAIKGQYPSLEGVGDVQPMVVLGQVGDPLAVLVDQAASKSLDVMVVNPESAPIPVEIASTTKFHAARALALNPGQGGTYQISKTGGQLYRGEGMKESFITRIQASCITWANDYAPSSAPDGTETETWNPLSFLLGSATQFMATLPTPNYWGEVYGADPQAEVFACDPGNTNVDDDVVENTHWTLPMVSCAYVGQPYWTTESATYPAGCALYTQWDSGPIRYPVRNNAAWGWVDPFGASRTWIKGFTHAHWTCDWVEE